MKKLNAIIEDTNDNDDSYPTTTPWWCNGECLLLGCLFNENLVCMKKKKDEFATCDFELPIPINCRFKLMDEGSKFEYDNENVNIYGRPSQERE